MSSISAGSTSSYLNISHHLSFVHYNVQSILPKMDILTAELSDFDILAFSETWLRPEISTDSILIPSFFKPERKDRPTDAHGGVMIYVKDNITYTRRQDIELPGIECIWIEVIVKHNRMLFGLFYRAPDTDQFYYSTMEDSIHLAVDTGIRNIIVTGDFNYNMLNNETQRKISNICQQFSLTQCITEPTHYTERSASLIDLILTSNRNTIISSGVADPFLPQQVRYHCPIYGILNFCKPKSVSLERNIWLYDRGNYDLLREKASLLNWVELQDDDINIYAKNITDTIMDLSKQCIPNKSVRVKSSDPPWITSSVKKHIRARRRLYRKAKQTDDVEHWNRFRRHRNKTLSLIRKAKQLHIDKLKEKLTSNQLSSKDWWATLKHFISPSRSSSIPPLNINNVVVSDPTEKANLLNNYFRDQTILNDNNVEVPLCPPHDVISELNSLVLNPEEVLSILKSLPTGKAVGPDGVSNRILKELAEKIHIPLTRLFNHCLSKSCVPLDWKKSNVSPVPKSDDTSLPSNYRPISLLSNIDKVFERCISKHVYNHLHVNNILTSFQSGFTPRDSTTNQLTFLYNTFSEALDSGKEVRVVFCDISKAFDQVWHNGLLCKLKAAGITGTLLDWFKDYLADRKQRVVIPGVMSDWNDIKAGVPQGSILGPLLFLIFINDIVTDIGSNIRLFADDTSLYIIVENPDEAARCMNFDLHTIFDWACKWLVKFCPPKTDSMLLSRKLLRPYHPPLFMSDTQIKEVAHHKHLGIYLSSDCSWHTHINYIKEKAWQRLNVMRRLKFVLDRRSLETIYTSFIRPLLEYGDMIWDNCTLYEKRELDKIQNEAARIATGASALVSIEALHNEIGWESLQTRRTNHKLSLFFKMQHDLTPSYLSNLVPPSVSETSRYALRNADDYTTILCNSQHHYSSFLPTVVRDWNNLPQQAKQIGSLISFKAFLTKDKIQIPKYYYTGKRKWQVMHTRIRTNSSALNTDLFRKNIVDSASCTCGAIENAYHFFFMCGRYTNQRNELFHDLDFIPHLSLNLLLYGDVSKSIDYNIRIFEAVHKFIERSRRFN